MREAILLLTAGACLALAYVAGDLAALIAGDSTGLVWGVAGLGIVGTVMARRRRAWLVWLCEWQVTTLLGLLGTVLGIWQAMQGLDGTPGPEELAGAFTALTTTAAGLIVHLWLMVVREATR